MKRTFVWILIVAVIITLTSCTAPRGSGTANPETGTMVPATPTGEGQPAAPDGATVLAPARTDPAAEQPASPAPDKASRTSGGKNDLTSKDESTIQDIRNIINDAQQYLKDETLPDISTD